MKSDLYTKFVLTVIALALSTIALQHAIPSAFAQSENIQKVVICDPQNPSLCAEISSRGALKIRS
jgi:hypothetical protein